MADQTQGSIHIDADKAAIMAVITDFASYPDWSGEIRVCEVRETGADGRATKVYLEVVAAIISAKYTLGYTYAPDNGGMSWTFVEGGPIRDLQGSYELVSDGAGTTVTYRVSIDPGIPIMGFLRRQGEKKVIDGALKGLKKRVESRQ